MSDATIDEITATPELSIAKTGTVSDIGSGNSGVTGVGDLIIYSIVVTNTGNVDLSSVSLGDTIIGLSGTALALTGSLTFQSASLSSNQGILLKGETA